MDNDINREAAALLEEFLTIDDLQRIAADAGALLGCPLLVIDDAYHVSAHYLPLGFSDKLFQDAVRVGEITYEAGAIISQSSALTAGKADYIELDESQFRRRFAPLVSAGVRIGYLVCIDIDRHLDSIQDETWKLVESILAKEFQLKVIISEPICDIMQLPALYKTAREALELMFDDRFTAGNVCKVDELRLPLLLKKLESRTDLVLPELKKLAKHDKEKGTQLCETLYWYLCCNRSLAKTGDMLYTHRNTILYRIRKIRDDFGISLDDEGSHTELLLGVSVLLFADRGAEFFMSGIGAGK